jgi:pyridoxine/pyridoxamine 5'-phosphate oxidase
MTRDELVQFIRRHRHAVQASIAPGGAPQAAVVGIACSDELELVFDTLTSTRKYQNLMRDPRIAFVIGWDDQTVQLEGTCDEPSGAERERVKQVYFAQLLDGRDREAWEGITWLRVRPTWIRYSDFRGADPRIVQVI